MATLTEMDARRGPDWDPKPGQPVMWRRHDDEEWRAGVFVGADPDRGAEIRYVEIVDGHPQGRTTHLGMRLRFVDGSTRELPDVLLVPLSDAEARIEAARVEAVAHIDPATGMPWALRDRNGRLWQWGLDSRCGRWGYLADVPAPGGGHAHSLAELEADDDPVQGTAPVERVPWS